MLGSRVRAPEGVLKEKNESSSLFFMPIPADIGDVVVVILFRKVNHNNYRQIILDLTLKIYTKISNEQKK